MRRLALFAILAVLLVLTPRRAEGQFGVCETWMSITQYPPSQTTDSTAYIVVEWGDIQTGPPVYCVEGGTSNFQFTINGADRTGYFNVGWTSATGTVPLAIGLNELVASVDGYDAGGNPVQYFDTRYTTRIATQQYAPVVTLKHQNGTNLDRSRCLTLGAGEAAAIQCGDLLVAHGLPPYRTMGRDRSLTLLYNSATAVPRPLVAAAVTQNAQGVTPTSVKAEFWTYIASNWVKRAEATYGGWGGGETRQVALAFDASGLSTAIDSFELRITNNFSQGSPLTTVVAGVFMLVNRSSSEFGTGWHPVGVERLVLGQPGSRILWVGGDGSAVTYAPAGANKWAAAAAEFRDTVEWTGSQYVRRLKDRVQVKYDATGRHTQTFTATGATTAFYWNGGTGRLDSIRVPPAGASGTTYWLVYDGNGKIDKLYEPTGRLVELTVTSGRLTSATDFDLTPATSFTYDGSGRLTSRTGRGGHATSYTYGNGIGVTQVRIPLAAADTAASTVEHWNEKGLGVGFPGGTLTAAADNTLYTKLFGPRVGVADDATYWLDRWGAPISVTDPRGYVTLFTRGDTANPALVTRVQYPNGRKLGLSYNVRGNVTQLADSTHEGTGSTQVVVTTFQYNDADNVDQPSSIVTPGGTTQIAYNAAFGLPETITAPGGHQTGFQYLASGSLAGLLDRVTEYNLAVVDTATWTESAATNDLMTQFYYDQWGNDTAVASPMGHRSRKAYDSYRRVIYTFDPMGHRTRRWYSVLNQIDSVTQYEDSLFTGPKTTRYIYDDAGAVTVMRDPRDVRLVWNYDWAGRPTVMHDEQEKLEYRYYNRAGLLDSVKTRLGHVIRLTYDAAGLLTKTKYPSTYDARRNITVPSDSVVRTYDAMGRLATAWNSQGTVTKSYHREGTLKTETQQIGSSVTFSLRSWYDTANRRTRFYNGIDTLTYGYGTDGLLSQLMVTWVNAGGMSSDLFRFKWDGMGRRDSVIYTNGTRVGFGYDRDGRLRLVCSVHSGGGLDDHLDQRLRYGAMDKDGMPLTVSRTIRSGDCNATSFLVENQVNTYDGRHQLLTQSAMGISTTFQYDNSGSLIYRQVGGGDPESFTIPGLSNRITERWVNGQFRTAFKYNLNGDRVYDSVPQGDVASKRHFYYNALGRMSGSAAWVSWVGGDTLLAESATSCRYDALGRRIASCEILGMNPWLGFDGNNVVRANAEQWRYVHGPGLDDPLVGVYKYAWNEWRRFYYLTDGRGRFLAFTNADGYDKTTEVDYYQNGGALAGAIPQSFTFDHGRGEVASLPEISFYRNRYYDQRTGRWTQEDPIGIAGGVNLYGFAGNNPAAFTDPFGLFPWAGIAGLAVGAVASIATGGVAGFAVAAAATTAGAAVSAGIESIVTGDPFWGIFERNFSISAAYLGGSAMLAWAHGAYAGAGANGLLQGYIKWSKAPFGIDALARGGFTLGPASSITGGMQDRALTRVFASLAGHEFGHTFQFVALSFFGSVANPWISYSLLGLPGVVGWGRGNPWEELASWLRS